MYNSSLPWPHPAPVKGVATQDYTRALLGVMTILARMLLYAEWSSSLDIVDYTHTLEHSSRISVHTTKIRINTDESVLVGGTALSM